MNISKVTVTCEPYRHAEGYTILKWEVKTPERIHRTQNIFQDDLMSVFDHIWEAARIQMKKSTVKVEQGEVTG